jgi:hypothetical protein
VETPFEDLIISTVQIVWIEYQLYQNQVNSKMIDLFLT